MHRGKVDPGVSELPRGNELSRDHVNRPLEGVQGSEPTETPKIQEFLAVKMGYNGNCAQ